MQNTLRSLQRPAANARVSVTKRRAVVVKAVRAQQQKQHAEEQQQQASDKQWLSTAAAAAASLTAALPALAEEVALDGDTGASPAFYAVAVVPLLTYGLFYIYRDRVNPKANFGDLAYILGAVVVFGNILSILIFKTRFF